MKKGLQDQTCQYSDALSIRPESKGLYEIPVGNKVKKAMQEDDIVRVLNYDPKFTLDTFDINMFQLSLPCNGMNMADIFELRNDSIQGGYLVFFNNGYG